MCFPVKTGPESATVGVAGTAEVAGTADVVGTAEAAGRAVSSWGQSLVSVVVVG